MVHTLKRTQGRRYTKFHGIYGLVFQQASFHRKHLDLMHRMLYLYVKSRLLQPALQAASLKKIFYIGFCYNYMYLLHFYVA